MSKKSGAIIEIIILVISIFAFSFSVAETSLVVAQKGIGVGSQVHYRGEIWNVVRSKGGSYSLEKTTGEKTFAEGFDSLESLKKALTSSPNPSSPVAPGATPTPAGGSSWTSKNIFGIKKETSSTWGWGGTGGMGDALISGLQWAVVVYGIVKIGTSILGMEKVKSDALSMAAAAGVGIGKILAVGGQSGGFLPSWATATWVPWVGGVVVGLLVLEMLWKDEKTKQQIVSFECFPYEPPIGGENCEKCNSDFYPCSEYRCKSLGQACQILNKGKNNEKCAWVNPHDVNAPVINIWKEALTKNHEYKPDNAIHPPDNGVKILNKQSDDKNGCIKAFTPLSFGIQLDEPSQCKIDYNRTGKFDQMTYFFGGDNSFAYNHSITMSLPGPDAMNATSPELKNDGNYNLYVRCRDANNNQNDGLFVFSFCVEKRPDKTPPKIEGTSIANNMPVQYGLNETELEVYTNEPAECRWSRSSGYLYEQMETKMTCSNRITEMNNLMLYKCKTTLTGLQDRKDNDFYFRCKDQPWLGNNSERNANSASFKFTLRGTQPLTIEKTLPNRTIKGGTTITKVVLDVKTNNGYKEGDAFCSYSLTQNEKDYIGMFETGKNRHLQELYLSSGTYTYYFQCVDLGGNAARNSTTFSVEADTQAPEIVRIYNEGGKLKIITDEKSTCSYSTNNEKKCDFQINNGVGMTNANATEHFADWEINQNYYIKCTDMNDRQPNPAECSIVVMPREEFNAEA